MARRGTSPRAPSNTTPGTLDSWVTRITGLATPVAVLLGFFLPDPVAKKIALVSAIVLVAVFALGGKRRSGKRRTNFGQLAAVSVAAAFFSAAIVSARYEWREVRVLSLGEQIVPGAGPEGGESWRAPALNPKNQLLAVAQSYAPNTQNIIVLDLSTSALVKKLDDKAFGELPAVGEEGRLAFSPNGDLLAIGGAASSVDAQVNALWLMRTYDWHRIQLKTVSNENVSDVVFSPDGQTLASAQDRIYVWKLNERELAPDVLDSTCGPADQKYVHFIGDRSNYEAPLTPSRIAFSPDGMKLLAWYKSDFGAGCFRLWDVTEKRSRPIGEGSDLEGQRITNVYFDSQSDPHVLTFSDGGATATKTNTLFHVFSLSRNMRTFDFETGLAPFSDVLTAISPNRRFIAVAQDDTIKLFQFGEATPKFTISKRYPVGIAFSSDSQTLIVTDRQRDSASFFARGLWIFGVRIPGVH